MIRIPLAKIKGGFPRLARILRQKNVPVEYVLFEGFYIMIHESASSFAHLSGEVMDQYLSRERMKRLKMEAVEAV